MSVYTTQLRWPIEQYKSDHPDAVYDDYGFNEGIWTMLGLDEYPIFDESHRPALNAAIIRHYYFREIAFETLAHVGAVLSGLAHSGQIAFYIGQEHGDAHIGKGFCHHLHSDGFAGAGGAGDEAMAVCHGGQQIQVLLPLGQPNLFISVHRYFLPKAIGVLH